MTLWELVLLFGIGNVAGLLNVLAGGGSSLTLPALILLGLDPSVANGTNRIAIFVQNFSAVASFRRREHAEWAVSFRLSLWAIPGAIAGAVAAVRISDIWFQKILGVVLVGVIITMLIPRRNHPGAEPAVGEGGWAARLSMLGVGLYGGFIQVGVGFLLMAALYHALRESLARVNMHKVFIVLIYTLPALLIFVVSGNIAWLPGVALAAGTSLGGWWAAHLSVKRGERFIRGALVVAILIIALKLLGVY